MVKFIIMVEYTNKTAYLLIVFIYAGGLVPKGTNM